MTTLNDNTLKTVLTRASVVAVVGLSADPLRPSHAVASYLVHKGYRVIPVNPALAGQTLLGEPVRATLADCPPTVDMVDIFRRSDHVPAIIADALSSLPALRTIWMQLGVAHADAAALARARGIDVIQNRCPKIDYDRLFGGQSLAAIRSLTSRSG